MQLEDPLLLREQCFIDGRWVSADDGGTLPVHNPATAETLGVIPNMGAAETRRAIAAAAEALPAWAARTAKDRAIVLRRWFDLMLEHQQDLAVLMTAEQGKPLAESKGEIPYAASFIEWFAEEGKRLYGDIIPGHQADKRILVLRQPVGVVAAITPWNFPSAMITRKAGPALAAGCTMVLKPATQTPYSALALAELADRAGIPRGVFNVITGSAAAIGGEMTANPTVRKVTFTGSTEDRQETDGAMRRHDQEAVAGTGRQCAVHRVRRCRFGCRGSRSDREQVPQYRSDLRLRQPLAGAGRRVRGICEETDGGGRQVARRRRPQRRDRSRTADRCEGRRQGRGAHRGRRGEGSERGARRQTPCAGRHFFRADDPHRT